MNKDLIKKTEELIYEVNQTHRYSMSKIYGIYNEIFGTNERPQSCASCLIRKVNMLKKWLESQTIKEEKQPLKKRSKSKAIKTENKS